MAGITKPKILVFDIETAPKKAYIWSMWKQNTSMDKLIADGYMLCWSAKWLGDDYIMSDSLNRHDLYKKDPENDSSIAATLWDLINEADMVIAHNGNRFDIPVMNARFVTHGMKPPATYKSIDTLQIARKYFKFTSNRLDALGQLLGLGRKKDTGGFDLWKDVMNGNKKAWKKMVEYCEQDVLLLESVYDKLKAWNKQHPNVNLYGDLDRPACAVCGSTHVNKQGYDYTAVSVFQRWKCMDCGHQMRERSSKVTKEQRKNILSSSK